MQERPTLITLGLPCGTTPPPCIPVTPVPTGLWLVCGPSWHSSHKNGGRDFSNGVMLEPCGVWQLVQSSVTGWCSHANGPRFSAWQPKQVSVTVFFASSFG